MPAILDLILNSQIVQWAIAAAGGVIAIWVAKRRGVRQGRAQVEQENMEVREHHGQISREVENEVAGHGDGQVNKDFEKWAR